MMLSCHARPKACNNGFAQIIAQDHSPVTVILTGVEELGTRIPPRIPHCTCFSFLRLDAERKEAMLAMTWGPPCAPTGGVGHPTRMDRPKRTWTPRLSRTWRENCWRIDTDPRPLRRAYIPKGRNRRHGLGIPTLCDWIVQVALAQVLGAIYEPIFRNCASGFRLGRSTIHALRHVGWAYRAGATWMVKVFRRPPDLTFSRT